MNDGLATGLRAILHQLLPDLDEDLDEDADLFQVGLDSLKAVEFVLQIEEQYCVQFRFSDITYQRFKTISSVVNLVRESSSPLSSSRST